MRLENKVAFITGAGAGIGRACAQRFAAEGASVVIAEIDEQSGRASEAEVGTDHAMFVQTDVTDEHSVASALAHAQQRFGRVNVLVNCAGGSIAEDKAVTEVAPAVWDHTMNLDLKGPFLCCRLGIVLSERVAGRLQMDQAASPEEQIAESVAQDNRLVDRRHPFGHGMPEDIANVALFLASDESRMVNAAVIPAEGGASHY